MASDRVFTLEKEVAVINSKLDEIHAEFKGLREWMVRHEAEHNRIRDEREQIRQELRHQDSSYSQRVGKLEREHTAFSARQNVINAIIGFIAGAAASAVVSIILTGSLG